MLMSLHISRVFAWQQVPLVQDGCCYWQSEGSGCQDPRGGHPPAHAMMLPMYKAPRGS